MIMEKVFTIGDRIEFDEGIETAFDFNFLPLDIFDNWERAGTLSDFIAEYFGSYFENEASYNLISTIFNEFIENAVKFTRNNSQPIQIVVKKRKNALLSRITNSIPSHRQSEFIGICQDLFTRDLDELFVEKIEDGADDMNKSGIGLILIKKDYQVKTSFDFYKDSRSMNNVAITFMMDL